MLLIVSLAPVPVHGDEPYGTAAAASAPPTPSTQTMDMDARRKKCREQWKKYRENQACFAPYRLVNGGVKAEAFKHCKDMKQPELCE